MLSIFWGLISDNKHYKIWINTIMYQYMYKEGKLCYIDRNYSHIPNK